MLALVIKSILAVVLAWAIHEGSHWFKARRLGVPLVWKWEGWRLTWTVPLPEDDPKQNAIEAAGFAGEFIAVLPLALVSGLLGDWIFPFVYLGATIVHRLLYPLYSKGKPSDFD